MSRFNARLLKRVEGGRRGHPDFGESSTKPPQVLLKMRNNLIRSLHRKDKVSLETIQNLQASQVFRKKNVTGVIVEGRAIQVRDFRPFVVWYGDIQVLKERCNNLNSLVFTDLQGNALTLEALKKIMS